MTAIPFTAPSSVRRSKQRCGKYVETHAEMRSGSKAELISIQEARVLRRMDAQLILALDVRLAAEGYPQVGGRL